MGLISDAGGGASLGNGVKKCWIKKQDNKWEDNSNILTEELCELRNDSRQHVTSKWQVDCPGNQGECFIDYSRNKIEKFKNYKKEDENKPKQNLGIIKDINSFRQMNYLIRK